MYVKTCEKGRVKDFEQRSRVYNMFFPVDPDDHVIMESQYIYLLRILQMAPPLWLHCGIYRKRTIRILALCSLVNKTK